MPPKKFKFKNLKRYIYLQPPLPCSQKILCCCHGSLSVCMSLPMWYRGSMAAQNHGYLGESRKKAVRTVP